MKGAIHGLLVLLKEKDSDIKTYAINELTRTLPDSWPLMADYLPVIKKLAENVNFASHLDAAHLASIISYYLGDNDTAFLYALLSKDRFKLNAEDDYTSRIISHAFQKYIEHLKSNEPIETDHEDFVKSCIKRLLNQDKYAQVLTLAFETHNGDALRIALENDHNLASGAIQICLETAIDNDYKKELLDILVNFSMSHNDKFQLSQLYLAMQDYERGAQLIESLCTSNEEDDKLMGYQIAFELAENARQQYRSKIIDLLPHELENVKNILTRKLLLKEYLYFLFSRNRNDIEILINIKDSLDTQKPIIHTSVTIAYSYMYAGTGDDNFFRANVHYFTQIKKWAQFTTAAAIGGIHIGHLEDAMTVLNSFLEEGAPEYVRGGAIYALGLIYVNYTWENKIIEKVIENLHNSRDKPILRHGACLALGLISMGSHNLDYSAILQNVLNEDVPEPGEAAGYALGMVMLGSGDENTIDFLMKTISKTQHEKIQRGIAMGLGFVMYGKGAEANGLIDKMMNSGQALVRLGAAWVISLANIGNASNDALQKLLHIAVSDVNDNVRRAAVIGVGFVLSRRPKEVPAMVKLLSQSYHPHVRSGAALAIGISCAGTGNAEAIEVLKPLLEDNEDIVVQNAMIAMAMVMMQQSDARVPYAKEFRKFLRSKVSHKRDDMQTFGMCCAWGILNAGGRNVVISCNSLRGENSVSATVGLAMFCNYFFWIPLSLMLPLSFHPTAIIGLDENLEVVDWSMRCFAPHAYFSYPPNFNKEINENKYRAPERLSISKPEPEPEPFYEEEEEEEEDNEIIIENRSRVTLSQLDYISTDYDKSYSPVIGHVTHGFIMLKKGEDYKMEDNEEDNQEDNEEEENQDENEEDNQEE